MILGNMSFNTPDDLDSVATDEAKPEWRAKDCRGAIDPGKRLCCGREVLTPFCPHCGATAEPPLALLLAHCRQVAERTWQRLYELKAGNQTVKVRAAVAKAGKKYAKWKVWADALEGLLSTSAIRT